MHSLLQLMAVLVVWGLLPACIYLFVQMHAYRATQKRGCLSKSHLREWRTRVPYVTPAWPRRAFMDTACQDEGVLWYVSTCREDALRQEVTTCAQRALRSSAHIQN